MGQYLLALRSGQGDLDAVIAHAERVFHDDPRYFVGPQQLDKLVVRADRYNIDEVAGIFFGYDLRNGPRRYRIRNEYATKVVIPSDDILHDHPDRRWIAVGDLVGDDGEGPIFGREHLLEALSALIERGDPRLGADHCDIAFGVRIGLRDRHSESIRGDTARIHVVGRQQRGHGLRIGGRVDADDFDFLGGLIDGLPERGKLRGRDDDRRGI